MLSAVLVDLETAWSMAWGQDYHFRHLDSQLSNSTSGVRACGVDAHCKRKRQRIPES